MGSQTFQPYSQPPLSQGSSLLSTPFFSSQMSYRQVWICHPGSQFQHLHWHNHTVHLLCPLTIWYLNFSSLCIFLAFIFSNPINILFGPRVISNPILIYIVPALSNFCDFTHFRIISEFNSLLHSYHYLKKLNNSQTLKKEEK